VHRFTATLPAEALAVARQHAVLTAAMCLMVD
jgi:hypothetical protein